MVQRLAYTAGLIVVDVEELPTHGGSLRLWLARRGAGRKVSTAVKNVALQEQTAGLETLGAWAQFQHRAEGAKNGLLRFLLQEKEAGRVVMGYGAAAKGNTLLNYAGVRADLLPAVADRAHSKQGLYLPGSHIPVISPEELATHNPQKLLVLPWNLMNEIEKQWPSHQLVTAIPELQQRG